MKIFLYSMIMSMVMMFMSCSSSSKLSKIEMEKLDPALQKLVLGENPSDKNYNVRVQEDGSKTYGVIINSSNPSELTDVGITPNSVTGDIITAKLTIEELRKVVLLPSVKSVKNVSKSYSN